MGDELGDEWWQGNNNSGPSEDEADKAEVKTPEKSETKKRKSQSVKPAKAKKKKTDNKRTECFVAQKTTDVEEKVSKKSRRKKKKITQVLASTTPKPGCPADLWRLIEEQYSDSRSAIEMEELKLPDSCFLPSNDLTHSLSSFLKEICPKWAKLCKQHTEKKSVIVLVVCSSAHRTLELINEHRSFKGTHSGLHTYLSHLKVEQQMQHLEKSVAHIGVGTPGRIKALIEKDGLTLNALKYVVLDWNWRDQKLRRLADIPEVRLEMLKLLETGIIQACKAGTVKLGLY
uniref:Cms1 ribosomal small subunit homolog n=1 Tax=Lepisosteus oculatus TaxID=7918 RepID=W5MSU5_LEPOC